MLLLANEYISCGGMKFPADVASFARIIYNLLLFVTPIIIIVMGSTDYLKAVVGSDEAAIKRGQKIFVQRLIAGGIVFFVLTVLSVIISVVAETSDEKSYGKCLQCLTTSEKGCDKAIYIEEDDSLPQGEEYGR